MASAAGDLLRVVGILAALVLMMCAFIFVQETCKQMARGREDAGADNRQELRNMPWDPSSITETSSYSVTEPSQVHNGPSVNQQRSRRPRGTQGPIDFQLTRGRSTMDGSVNTTDSQVIQGQGTYRLGESSDENEMDGVLFDPDSENFRRRQERKRRRED